MSLLSPQKARGSRTRRPKVCRESHSLHKQSSSTSSASSSLLPGAGGRRYQHQHNHPLITYTHAPKVIHTSPSEFMALVQKLTGLSRDDDAGEHRRRYHKTMHEDADGSQYAGDELSSSLCAIAANGDCFDSGLRHASPDQSVFYPIVDELDLDLVMEDANFMASNFSLKP